MATTNPHKHVKGADGCIALFCAACAWEQGYHAGVRYGLDAANQAIPLPYYTDAEIRWLNHCDEVGRPTQWAGPHGRLP